MCVCRLQMTYAAYDQLQAATGQRIQQELRMGQLPYDIFQCSKLESLWAQEDASLSRAGRQDLSCSSSWPMPASSALDAYFPGGNYFPFGREKRSQTAIAGDIMINLKSSL
jgi:hypothetical protein